MALAKKSFVTIGGKPGGGKSTASKNVSSELGFTKCSTGDFFRSIAEMRGVSLIELNLLAEKDSTIDFEVDEMTRRMMREDDKVVIDSRMAWHWMGKCALNVFLDLDLHVAAERIIAGMTEERLLVENVPSNPEEYAAMLQVRLDSEALRYNALYEVNPYNIRNYDLVIDTARHTQEAVAGMIVKEYGLWRAN